MHEEYSARSYWRSAPRRLKTVVIAVVVASALLPTAPTRAGADVVFEFRGGGYGHSVGLSQFGAYGMALHGYSAEEILAHYYTGTAIQDVDPVVAASPLWVNLSQEQTRISLTTTGTGTGPAGPVTYHQAGASVRADPGQTATIDRLADGTCRVQTPAGTLAGPCTIDAEWGGWDAEPATAVVLQGCTLPNWNDPAGTVYQPCTYAHGELHVRPDDDTNTFHLSLEIDIESYVLGISESPYFWGADGGMEALRAQAVAARTYALRKAYDRGDPEGRPSCACNLYDTTVDQFYVGWGQLTPEWREAVTSTDGKVVTHPATVQDSVQLPIQAFYSSSTFGWTEHSEHGFSAYVPYLRGVDDHWSQLPEVGNHSARWTAVFTGTELAQRLPGLSTVTGIDVTACSPSGAILELTFRGSGGPRTFRTSDLRTRLGIKSMQVFNVGAPPPAELPCPGPGTQPLPPGGPVSIAGIRIDDDAHEDSRGDGDGIPEAGEIVEVYVTLRNEGEALSGVETLLTSSQAAATVQWNADSGYPALAAGAVAENDDDWDVALADTATGTVYLDLTVTAANGGPWTLQVPVTIGGPAAAGTASGITAIGDVGGGPGEDIAVTYRSPGGAPRLRILDPATGTTIADVQIGSRDVTVTDIEPVPGRSEVAILLTSGENTALVRLHDSVTGERTGSRRFGGARAIDWTHLVVIPGAAPGDRTALGVFGEATTGAGRIVVKAADTPERLSVLRVARHTAVADLTAVADRSGDGITDVAVLGRRSFGTDVVLVFDTMLGSQVTSVGLSARNAAALMTSTDTGAMVVVSTHSDGRAFLDRIDPATATRNADAPLELHSPAAVASLPSGSGVAVLGLGPTAAPTIVVVDAATGSTLSSLALTPGTPVGLAALEGDQAAAPTVAGLIGTVTAASVEVAEALTGTPVRSIPIA